MYLFWTGASHFVEGSFWSWVNKFIPSGIRPADNNFVTPSQEGVAKLLSPRFFSVFMRVSGLCKVDFSKSPHRGCPTPKRAKKRSFCMYSALVVAAHSLFRNIGVKSYWSLCWVLCRIARVLCCLMCRPVWLIDTGCFLSFDLNRIGSSLPSEKVAVWYLYARSR